MPVSGWFNHRAEKTKLHLLCGGNMDALRNRTAVALLMVVTMALAGCIGPQDAASGPRAQAPSADASCPPGSPGGSAGGGQGGGGQQGVSNRPGSFSYGGQVAGRTATETHAWTNPATSAAVAWSGQVAAGEVRLVLLDACGTEVYAKTLGRGQGGVSERTPRAVAGAWTIQLHFTGFTGQMGLSVTAS